MNVQISYRHTCEVLEQAPWEGVFDPLAGVILNEQTMDVAAG